jgi:hypothetical protein
VKGFWVGWNTGQKAGFIVGIVVVVVIGCVIAGFVTWNCMAPCGVKHMESSGGGHAGNEPPDKACSAWHQVGGCSPFSGELFYCLCILQVAFWRLEFEAPQRDRLALQMLFGNSRSAKTCSLQTFAYGKFQQPAEGSSY